jgi:predicted  nucleic acid-binding Zn-ribbon protein
MTSATPKPRAGEHQETDTEARRFADGEYMADYVPANFARKLEAELDQLRERERNLVEALAALIDGYSKWTTRQSNAGEWLETQANAKAALAKHGR